MSRLIVTLDHRVCTVPEARLKVLPFTELSIGENQFNTEPTRGSCLINPFKKHTQTKSNICCHTHVDMHTPTTLLISKCTKYNYSFTFMVFFSLNSNGKSLNHHTQQQTSSISFSSLAFCSCSSASRMPFLTTSVMFSKSCTGKKKCKFKKHNM